MPGLTDVPNEASEERSDVALLRRSRTLLENDRALMLKANKAYVSHVRAYQAHQLTYLFPFKSLDLGALAMAFCVLRLPRMKEILGRKIKNFQSSKVHPGDVPFKDKKQEKLRQVRLKKEREDANNEWNQNAEEAASWQEGDAEAKKKLQAEIQEKGRTRTEKRKAGKKGRAEEWRLLQVEEGLARKMRKGSITATGFTAGVRKAAKQLEISDEEDEDGDNPNDSDGDSSDSGNTKKKKKAEPSSQDKQNARWLNGRKRRRKKGRKR